MGVETAADRATMLSVTDFGTLAVYKSKGKRYPINGIFDREYLGVDVAEAEFASSEPVFHIRTADLPCLWAFGDVLDIDCTLFNIRNVENDGTGMTKLRLEATS